MTEDPRRQSHRVLDYLNGDVDSGIGLLYRVLHAARAFSVDPGPRGPSGCIIGGGRSAPEGDSISEDDVLELCVRLKSWELGVETKDADEEKLALGRWLTAHHKEDHEYLAGLIERVRTRVKDSLAREIPSEDAVEDALALAWYLKAWMGTHCEHSFEVISRITQDIVEVRCERCSYQITCGVGQFPMARCEVCEGPMPRKDVGRPRSTCSDACRQRKFRNEIRK